MDLNTLTSLGLWCFIRQLQVSNNDHFNKLEINCFVYDLHYVNHLHTLHIHTIDSNTCNYVCSKCNYKMITLYSSCNAKEIYLEENDYSLGFADI